MSCDGGVVLQLEDEIDRVQHVTHAVGGVLHSEKKRMLTITCEENTVIGTDMHCIGFDKFSYGILKRKTGTVLYGFLRAFFISKETPAAERR